MTGRGVAQAEGLVAAARHGSYCPKMCTFACPVTAATGRDDAVPWSFHRTLIDLEDGRLAPGERAGERLSACTGCFACRVPCEFDQDVPSQVREGRRRLYRAGSPVAGTSEAVKSVGRGRSPFGLGPATDPSDGASASAVVLAGCRDSPEVVAAATRLLAASGVDADARAPFGCCGGTLRDLGADEPAEAARVRLAELLDGYGLVLVLDPHCLPDVRAAVAESTRVRYVIEELDDRLGSADLRFSPDPTWVTYHDPCLLARRDGITDEPRRLLAAAGAELAEPEHSGTSSACSGAGLAFELVDRGSAAATATRRRDELSHAGGTVVTACAGAGRLLGGAAPAEHLVSYLARRLPDRP